MDLNKRAKEIISKITYITIASIAEGGKPWNAPVFSAYDKDYNFYWGSYRESQHSKNIRANPAIFFVIYDSTVPPGTGEGVYIEAVAEELKDINEIKFAHNLLWDRHIVPYWKLEQVQGDASIRLYKAIPKRVWMKTGEEKDGHYIDTRTEVGLN